MSSSQGMSNSGDQNGDQEEVKDAKSKLKGALMKVKKNL
jgi:hypothetical protein